MAEIKKYTIAEPYLDLHAQLGEGPHWEQDRNTLRFVDIAKKKLYFIDLKQGPSSLRTIDLDFSIGVTADIESNEDEIVFGGKLGYGILNRSSGATRWIAKMWNDDERKEDGGGKPGVGKCKEDRMRSNDGAIDPKGRFLVGAMNDFADGFMDEGILFRLDSDLSLHRIKTEVTIPNGTSWSADGKTMYFTDSPTGTIKSYPYNVETGEVSWTEGKVFWTCPVEGGVPDGHVQDEEGHFWVACYGTARVFRVNPQGQVVAEVELPTRCATCPVFCGTELYITTAYEGQPEKYPWSEKYGGGLFKIDVGVHGAPKRKFRMDAKA
ncbi:Hypothetical protein R9X50_00005400 [Acrodontium crateriforme]|uniref:SMP-30/Gluconolactonase/LRE-like region domain-containing protein n=1 Tax=Acrodontium crateriforme TaxID=150365 RepID=A0AAQ3LZX9_9PEZI|nr:Hypothetical protein R9X50_00005400 [Acrodontium crateriforme]